MSEADDPRRLDIELVRRGLLPSRGQAREAIETGKVRVEGNLATKPGQLVTSTTGIEAGPLHPWVSRGGLKLDHALGAFNVDVSGQHCLDIGSSTGGFTDVLLTRGARRVVAVDVGTGQLHPKLKSDSRVVSLESTDARNLTADMILEPPTILVCDASFIGLAKLLGRPLALAAPGAQLIALFKPQFEVGREHVGKGGIVSNESATDAAAAALTGWLAQAGWSIERWTESPIAGGDGNRERLFLARN